MSTSIPLGERLLLNLDTRTEGCWEWTGRRDRDGYGVLSVDNRPERVHRLAWKLLVGAIPDGIFVLHHCDNPPCGRPTHLFLGDATVNALDRDAKDRLPRGETHRRSKLTVEDVKFIRAAAASGTPHVHLARRFDVNKTTIGNIVHRKSWTHV